MKRRYCICASLLPTRSKVTTASSSSSPRRRVHDLKQVLVITIKELVHWPIYLGNVNVSGCNRRCMVVCGIFFSRIVCGIGDNEAGHQLPTITSSADDVLSLRLPWVPGHQKIMVDLQYKMFKYQHFHGSSFNRPDYNLKNKTHTDFNKKKCKKLIKKHEPPVSLTILASPQP
jgi:hypothetical protein